MPVAAQCPSCGAPLSQASLLAVAPMCDHCGAVITTIGGTLGLTAPYALNDPVLTRERVEADLATLRNHRSNLAGMLEADKQKLSWGVEQHAILPNVPELLPLLPVPPFLTCLFRGLRSGAFGVLVSFGAIAGLGVLLLVVTIIVWVLTVDANTGGSKEAQQVVENIFEILGLCTLLYALLVGPACVVKSLWPYFKATNANGNRPKENARRQKDYQRAFAVALKAAVPTKAARDHDFRIEIRELEAKIKTVDEKVVEVSRALLV